MEISEIVGDRTVQRPLPDNRITLSPRNIDMFGNPSGDCLDRAATISEISIPRLTLFNAFGSRPDLNSLATIKRRDPAAIEADIISRRRNLSSRWVNSNVGLGPSRRRLIDS